MSYLIKSRRHKNNHHGRSPVTWQDFNDEMDRLFNWPSLGKSPLSNQDSFSSFPAINVTEKNNQYLITADLPGIEMNNLNVKLENDRLTISGSREEEHHEERKGFIHRERSMGSFSRQIYIPNANAEKSSAEYKNGVLKITIAKKTSAHTQKITIKTQSSRKTTKKSTNSKRRKK